MPPFLLSRAVANEDRHDPAALGETSGRDESLSAGETGEPPS